MAGILSNHKAEVMKIIDKALSSWSEPGDDDLRRIGKEPLEIDYRAQFQQLPTWTALQTALEALDYDGAERVGRALASAWTDFRQRSKRRGDGFAAMHWGI